MGEEMATNQLLPFANGDTANVISYEEWNALAARLTGFQSGIASSQQFNRILGQGGAAGYVIGQMVVDFAAKDATINCTALYAAFKEAVAAFVPTAIADKSISSAKIADGAITNAKLGADAVTDAKIADNSVGTEHIKSAAVTEAKIAANAVTTGKIANGAVTTAKIGADAVDGTKIADAAVGTEHLEDGAVTTAKIAAGAVTGTQLGSDSVTAAKIASGAVGNSELASNAVTDAKIASGAVSFMKIASGAIATQEQAEAGTASNVLMTPQRVAQAIALLAEFVSYNEQTLNSTQQTQARTNISALGKTEKAASASSADKWATKRTISINGDGTGSTSFDGSANASIALTIPDMKGATSSTAGTAGFVPAPAAGQNGKYLRGDGTWQTPPNTTYSNFSGASSSAAGKAGLVPAPAAGNHDDFLRGDGNWAAPTTISGNAGTATKLQTGRAIRTNLGSTIAVTFDGSANVTPGVTGTLPIGNGGTGRTDGKAVAWDTTRTISFTGDVTGSFTLDGSANRSCALSIAGASAIPTGMIAFFHATTPPSGWLLCNGQAVSRTTYADLFAKLGTKYGSGNGSSTFNLPNLHRRFLEGTTTTSEVGSLVSAGLPNITGQVIGARSQAEGFVDTGAFSIGEHRGGNWSGGSNEGSTKHTFDASQSNAIFSGSTVQPKSVRLLPCVKF